MPRFGALLSGYNRLTTIEVPFGLKTNKFAVSGSPSTVMNHYQNRHITTNVRLLCGAI